MSIGGGERAAGEQGFEFEENIKVTQENELEVPEEEGIQNWSVWIK